MFFLYKTYLLSFVGRHKGAYGKPGNPESGFRIPEFHEESKPPI